MKSGQGNCLFHQTKQLLMFEIGVPPGVNEVFVLANGYYVFTLLCVVGQLRCGVWSRMGQAVMSGEANACP